jgi:hypothetical protein
VQHLLQHAALVPDADRRTVKPDRHHDVDLLTGLDLEEVDVQDDRVARGDCTSRISACTGLPPSICRSMIVFSD